MRHSSGRREAHQPLEAPAGIAITRGRQRARARLDADPAFAERCEGGSAAVLGWCCGEQLGLLGDKERRAARRELRPAEQRDSCARRNDLGPWHCARPVCRSQDGLQTAAGAGAERLDVDEGEIAAEHTARGDVASHGEPGRGDAVGSGGECALKQSWLCRQGVGPLQRRGSRSGDHEN